MVRYFVFVASFFLVIVPSYLEAKAYYEEYDNLDRFYDVGRPGSPDKSNECRKDILLIVDTSRSITRLSFDDDVKPFLKNFVKDKALNVRRDGTQIALMIFAKKVKMLINFGEIFSANELSKNFDERLQWDMVQGGLTRTDLALEKALEVFSKTSPENNRDYVDDVIVLVTDGKPRGRSDRKDVYYVKKFAQKLKDNKVLIVTAAVGPQRKTFKPLLEEVATSPKYVVDAAFDDMKTIRAKLIASSCIKSGITCKCSSLRTTRYVESDNMKIKVSWAVPEAVCTDNPFKKIPMKNSKYSRPSGQFGVGKTTIQYSHLFGEEKITCGVTIDVKVCKCRDVGKVKAPLLKPGESKVEVSWKIPKPECIPNAYSKDMDKGMFSYGKTIKEYNYKFGQSKLTCPVRIIVDAVNCGGKRYDPVKNECCCGTVHKKKDSHECCGPEYININSKQCCPGYNVHLSGSKCPGD